MSLKAFHIFFVATSVLLAAGLGMMALHSFLNQHALAQLGWSLLSFAAAFALTVYGVRIRRKLKNVGFLLAALCLVCVPRTAWACATCYGNADSPQTHAMNIAILFMLGVVGTMLSLFAAFFLHLRNRAKQIAGQNPVPKGHGPFAEVYLNE